MAHRLWTKAAHQQADESSQRTEELHYMFEHMDDLAQVKRGADEAMVELKRSPCVVHCLRDFCSFLRVLYNHSKDPVQKVSWAVTQLMQHDALSPRDRERVVEALRFAFLNDRILSKVSAIVALNWWIITAMRLAVVPGNISSSDRFVRGLRLVGDARAHAMKATKWKSSVLASEWARALDTLRSNEMFKEMVRVEEVLKLRLHHAGVVNMMDVFSYEHTA